MTMMVAKVRTNDVYIISDSRTARIRVPWNDAPSGFAVMMTSTDNLTTTDGNTYDVNLDPNVPIELVNTRMRKSEKTSWSTMANPADVANAMTSRFEQMSRQMHPTPESQTAQTAAANRLGRIMQDDDSASMGMPNTTTMTMNARMPDTEPSQAPAGPHTRPDAASTFGYAGTTGRRTRRTTPQTTRPTDAPDATPPTPPVPSPTHTPSPTPPDTSVAMDAPTTNPTAMPEYDEIPIAQGTTVDSSVMNDPEIMAMLRDSYAWEEDARPYEGEYESEPVMEYTDEMLQAYEEAMANGELSEQDGLTTEQAATPETSLEAPTESYQPFEPVTLTDILIRRDARNRQPDYEQVTTEQGSTRAMVRIPWNEIPGVLEGHEHNGIRYPPRVTIVVPTEDVTTTRSFKSGSRLVDIRLTQSSYPLLRQDEVTKRFVPLDENTPSVPSQTIRDVTEAVNADLGAQRATQRATTPNRAKKTIWALDNAALNKKVQSRPNADADDRYVTDVFELPQGSREMPPLGLRVSSYPKLPDSMRLEVINLRTRKSVELTVPPVTDQDAMMEPYTVAIRTPYMEGLVRQMTAYGIIAPMCVRNASDGIYAHTVFAVRPEAALRLDPRGTARYEREYQHQPHAGRPDWGKLMPRTPKTSPRQPAKPQAFMEGMQKVAQTERLSDRMAMVFLDESLIAEAAKTERVVDEMRAAQENADTKPQAAEPEKREPETMAVTSERDANASQDKEPK